MLRRRKLKSKQDIAQMRVAGLVNWEAHRLAKSLFRPGATTRQVDAAVEAYFVQQQVTPLFKGVPGRVPFPAVCCMSVNEAIVHGIPDDRPLASGDIVSIDTGNRKDGWCADSAITHPIGEVRPEVQRLLDVTRDTLALAIDLLATSRKWSQVAAEMATFVRSAGFTVVEGFVGHGIGRQMHEDPQVPNYVSPELLSHGDFPIEEGLVIAVEPMVNLGTNNVRFRRDHWTVDTKDRKPSAHFEHTIAITSRGPEVLTAGPDGELWLED